MKWKNVLLTILHFQNDLIKHKKVKITNFIWTFSILGQLAQIWKIGPRSHKKVKISIMFLPKFY